MQGRLTAAEAEALDVFKHWDAMWDTAALCVLALPVRDEQGCCHLIETGLPPPLWRPPIPWRSIAREHVQAWLGMRPKRKEPWAP